MDDEKQGGVPPSGGDAPTEVNHPTTDVTPTTALVETRAAQPPALPPSPPPTPPVEPEDEEEGGMLRMSFMEHLEELRSRIIRALYGLGIPPSQHRSLAGTPFALAKTLT